MVSNESLHETAREILAALNNREKADLCSGRTFWDLHGVDRLGLPSIMMTDGPHGLRKQQGDNDHLGLSASVPAVCFPTAAGLASSWNRALLRDVGTALGEACLQERVSVLLGPGVNIKRSPLCGRNFEYFSEDPFLSGELASNWIQGVQSQGVGTSLKHFAVNNQENHRLVVDAIVDERTLREIYLPGFEIAVKRAQPWTVMCSYNLVNGSYVCESKLLLNDILKEEWRHTGLVVTDWGAANNRVEGLLAGLELDMPGNGGAFTEAILAAVDSGTLPQNVLDAAVLRIIELILKSRPALEKQHSYDAEVHHQLARRAAEESCVLLKNEGGLLPLDLSCRVGVVGEMARRPRYQGAGSSQINPTRIDEPLTELGRLLGGDAPPLFAPGYSLDHEQTDGALLDEALELARQVDTLIVFAGLPDAYESEGFDREHMRLPEAQLVLIEQLLEANRNVILVLQNGSPVELPFSDQVPAILETYLGGQAGGSAIARVLVGEVNPSGKLAESFPVRLEDTPCYEYFPGEPRQVQYREGIWVGYRYYCSADVPVAFPFGHGLSYTTFEYSNLRLREVDDLEGERRIDSTALNDWDGLLVQCDIKNTGSVAGSEIVQLYIGQKNAVIYRPRRELRDFDKVRLEAGESATVTFNLGRRSFACWEAAASDWIVPGGHYDIEVAASCVDIRLCATVAVSGEREPARTAPGLEPYFNPGQSRFHAAAFTALLGHDIPGPCPTRPYHLNSTLGEVSATVVGRKLAEQVKKSMFNLSDGNVDEKAERMMEAIVEEMPLRTLVTLSGGKVRFKSVYVLIHLMNRRYIKAIATAFSRARP